MKEYIPYTYLLHCKPINKFYYGVRYCKNCNPDEFWKSYFTSSGIVQKLRNCFGDDAFNFEIRKIFYNNPKAALNWEQKVIKRIKAVEKEIWLNATINGKDLVLYSVGKEPWNKGVSSELKGSKFYNNGSTQRMFKINEQPEGWVLGRVNKPWNKGLTKKDPRVLNNILNMSLKLKGRPAHNKGKPCSEELKQKLRNFYLGKTYEELYGKEKAEKIKENQRTSHKKRKKINLYNE